MRIKIITGLLILLPLLGFSQGEFNNWYFGNLNPLTSAAVTFNSGTPVAIPNGVVGKITANVSDSAGNLLFVVGNNQVYNKNLAVMPNGCCLTYSGAGFSQPIIATQKLDDDSSYYIFYNGVINPINPNPLRYSIVNMRLNGGLGDVEPLSKNIPVPGPTTSWVSVTGTRHGNNRDIWIVTTITYLDSIKYGSYLLTVGGLSSTPVLSQSFGDGIISSSPPLPPYMVSPSSIRISPDGTKLIAMYPTKMEYCTFNPITGQVTRLFFVNSTFSTFLFSIAEFSIDSKYLYLSTGLPGNVSLVLQYDAAKTDSAQFHQSRIRIDSANHRQAYFQMAPDWKIYGASLDKDSLCVISNPSNQGLSCNYQYNAVGLTGVCGDWLPQYVQKYKAYIHPIGNCQNSSIHFSGDIWPPPDSVHWDFGDPASGTANISNLPNPAHIYTSIGTYTVELFVRHNDNRTDTSWQTIHILPSPQPNLGTDRTICTGNSTTFDAGSCTGCTYQWKNLGSGLIVGTNQTFTTGTEGVYRVMVTNTNGCSGSDTVQLMTTTTPVVTNNPPLTKTICSGESTNILLTGNVPGVMFHWTATLTSGIISGFSADSGLVINQILINNGINAGLVTYHITPKIGDCAGTPVDFAVTVNVGDPVDVTITSSVNNICAGTSVNYSASPTNPGINPVYQWKVNGVNAGSNAPTFAYSPANGDIVKCILTSSNVICTSNNPATSNSITMVVNPIQPVSVVVSPSANPICSGTSVTFTAAPVNGGSTPVYQWEVNGLIVSTISPNYSYVPVNGDAITCTLNSNVLCPTGNPAISNTVTMTVKPILPVSVSIVASSNPFCLGSTITFTATPINGGLIPGYQWKVNGINAGINSPVLIYSPANGDVVTCSLLSSETCTTGNPAQSNQITMVVNVNLPAGITIAASANPFCPGSAVTFTATPVNGGSNPVYQWKVNGINAGTNSSSFSYVPINNDSVRCVINSNLSCVTGNPASSAKIIMIGSLAPSVAFSACFDTVTNVNAKPFKLKGGLPLGGTYSGPGVNSSTGIFTPSIAGIGVKTINYSYINVHDCGASKSKSIVVQPYPSFTCGGILVDTRDNKVYPTVQIGTQCWMSKNLDFGLTIASTIHQADNCIAEKYCYNGTVANCFQYGGLYQWDELMKFDDTPAGQGLCPPGWHVPTETDWTTLMNYYLGNGRAGRPLQDTIINGFKAQKSGVIYLQNSMSYLGFATLLWSSTASGPSRALAHGMNEWNFSVSLYPSLRANAFPIRCLKD